MILYVYDFNAILSVSLESKSGSDQLAGIKSIYDRLNPVGQKITIRFMDNEALRCVTKYYKINHISHHLVPPHVHRRNVAKRAIST